MHLFEFQDHPHTPRFLRATLLETLELCNKRFRPYYAWVTKHVIRHTAQHGYDHVVELGAGTGPIAKSIVSSPDGKDLQVTVCDLFPDADAYRQLEERHDGQIVGVLDPVDFRTVRQWGDSSVLVLSAVFHHIPPHQRREVLTALTESAPSVMVLEPLQKNPVSMFLAMTAIVPALLLPLLSWQQPERWRRVLWCWLLPLVPLMFVWDAVVSCLRQWSVGRWHKELATVLKDSPRTAKLSADVHSLVVTW